MRTNPVKKTLREGGTTIGTWLGLPDPFVAYHMAGVGFDWLNVDLEHSPINIETAALMFQAVAQAGGVPLARVPWASGENVKRVLDAGAWGVIYPMQNTRQEVEDAVSWAKYPPRGCRGMGGSLHAMSFGAGGSDYFNRANDETLVVIQIEHIDAVGRLDDLLSVPDVDAVFIGPNDLGASMGLAPGAYVSDPGFAAAVDEIRKACERHGVAPGLHVFSPEDAVRRQKEGFRFLALCSETRFMTAGAREALSKARSL